MAIDPRQMMALATATQTAQANVALGFIRAAADILQITKEYEGKAELEALCVAHLKLSFARPGEVPGGGDFAGLADSMAQTAG